MGRVFKIFGGVLMGAGLLACTHTDGVKVTEDIQPKSLSGVSSDGVKFYGDYFPGALDVDAPLILLFHQGGSNGRAEYAPLIPWLNALGYRAIAWDQRAGGDLYGSANRTNAGLSAEIIEAAQGDLGLKYCGPYPDVEGALKLVQNEGLAETVLVWGSSYSASLVFQLAAENPESVNGVLSFSPAGADAMKSCRAQTWADKVKAPSLAFRPASEMERASSVEQMDILKQAGVEFHIIENGVHGSSMLVDERTEHDMSAARKIVEDWLAGLGS